MDSRASPELANQVNQILKTYNTKRNTYSYDDPIGIRYAVKYYSIQLKSEDPKVIAEFIIHTIKKEERIQRLIRQLA